MYILITVLVSCRKMSFGIFIIFVFFIISTYEALLSAMKKQ